MEKIIIILLTIISITLLVIAIINTVRLKKLKYITKRKYYHTPKLSDLHGKEFSDYLDYLESDLY